LNHILEKSSNIKNPQIQLELGITGRNKRLKNAPKLKRGKKTVINLIDKNHLVKLDVGQLAPTQFILFIKFNRVKSSHKKSKSLTYSHSEEDSCEDDDDEKDEEDSDTSSIESI
jgi:hypothetical protein